MRYLSLLILLPAIVVAQEWTMLVYVAADNDLAQWADSDLVELERFGSDQNISVVVQVDKPSIGARRLLVGQGTSLVIQDLGIIDMCSWQTLADFIYWGIANFPARRYCVILWDHGSGWTLVPSRSFGADWSSGNVLSIASGDFQKALSAAYEYTGRRIDLFAFDACLMQQIEVAFETRNYALLFLAPQSVMPLAGFRYDAILERLHADPDMNASTLAHHIVQTTVGNYEGIQPVTLSAVDLSELNDLVQILSNIESRMMMESPNQSLYTARQNVQSIPTIGCTPDTTDDFIDLGDFIEGLADAYAHIDFDAMSNAYAQTILHHDYWGDAFGSTTGLTVWFPDVYRQFKQLLSDYENLDWVQSRWLSFLNWYYDSDDIRPTDPAMVATDPGSNNDFRLVWTGSYDLAPVTYNLVQATEMDPIFTDPCEDSGSWIFSGFDVSTVNPHAGNHSFFSGNAGNLSNYIETKDNVVIDDLGLMSIYLRYSTEDMTDSLIIEYGTFRDVHYGYSGGWIERTSILSSGTYPIRITYRTNTVINEGGCYIDDVNIYELTGGRFIQHSLQDTMLYVFNKSLGDYLYATYAEDMYANKSNLSNVVTISITDYAVPYSLPNPFQTSCFIVLDYPDTLTPAVEIYSLRGARLREFRYDQIVDGRLYWDGRDAAGREVGSGVYFIVLKDEGFKRVGKIARQR
ncbi:MAG: hypothetical protein JSW49_10325 [candidate division WOR-3 bacterium]|nr:MAG: hypothetical protein JSW49_10325 [candidate division WOR-3 bacterium]